MKSKTRKQLAKEYGICTKTFNRWLKQERIEIPRGKIKPTHLELIYTKIGVPKSSRFFPKVPINSN
jgi:abortive infection bacteriophage resistance protein